MRPLALAAALCALALPGFAQGTQPPCLADKLVREATSLSDLADVHYGDADYRFAILLATNARANTGPYKFIPDPLAPFSPNETRTLCIPQLAEAERLRNRFDTYEDAVFDMVLPVPSEISTSLDPLDGYGLVQVVSWVRSDQARWYSSQIGSAQPLTDHGDLWVTKSPKVQDFCTAYAQSRGAGLDRVTLRLEQRLGLPPKSAKTHFVTFEVETDPTNSQIFRPCVSPDVTTRTCTVGPPRCDALPANPTPAQTAAHARCEAHLDFFHGQYYTAFGVSLPSEFPWTSLGYTFDWAPGAVLGNGATDFQRYGESEYVIAAGAPVRVLSVTSTKDYCGIP